LYVSLAIPFIEQAEPVLSVLFGTGVGVAFSVGIGGALVGVGLFVGVGVGGAATQV